MSLDERKKHILESIVKDYVETAEPVGSRAVVKKHNLRVSAATVRNEMADLEDLGYLEQPHTSAGRIPSENGFRYYVDCMMEKEQLGEEEIDVLEKILKANLRDWDSVIQSIGSFLSQVTRYTSFIIVPTIKFNEFRYIQLIPVEPGTAMVILVTDTGILMHRKIDVPPAVEPKDLNVINEVFNRIFTGKRLEDLRKTDLKSLRDELKQRRKVIDQTLEAINSLMENTGDEKVVISGILNMLNEPEFKDLDKLKRILAILEADESLKSILPETIGDEVDITIGRENQREDVKEMSIVLARYTMFGESGKIGVIGPVRMEYWKAAGSVDSIRNIIDDTLKKHY